MSLPIVLAVDETGAAIDAKRFTVIQSVVPVTTNPTLLIPQNLRRLSLSFQVVGASHVCVAPVLAGQAPVVLVYGQGKIYESSGVIGQGASEDFCGMAPTNAFLVVGAGLSTVVVWEGV